MLIKTLTVGHLEANCYIVTDEKTLQCAVIDPGDESNVILDYIEDNHLVPQVILLTHGHHDHVRAAAAVSRCTFEMYLVSYLWDQLLYNRLSLPLPVTVLLVFAASFCSAWLLRLVLRPAVRGLSALYDKLLKTA